MKKMKILLLTITLILSTVSVISAQQTNPGNDTITVSIQQSESGNQTQTRTQAQEQNRTANQEQAQTGANTQARTQNKAGNASGIKKVQSARPDWSKARGARPPSVERPSGSRIPKGVGKPGGAKGPGKR
jgi:uncharacterized protein YxeA